MSKQVQIYELHASGKSNTEIARILAIDRKTVYRYLQCDDFSPRLPVKEKRASKLDPYKGLIDEWLEGDKSVFHKQHHTAVRIQERLRDECGFVCGVTIIQNHVRQVRAQKNKEGFLDLEWKPGYTQVDFGDVDVVLEGRQLRAHLLVVSFPYSNMGYCQLFLSECAECVCQGLTDIFAHIAGVPHTLVFDNATGVGRRIAERIIETELFSRFRMHYDFELRFCNTDAGHEKGNVERKVSYLRKRLFVPLPHLDDIDTFNVRLLDRCAFQEAKIHYRKEVSQGSRFHKDCATFATLPKKAFDPTRYEEYVSNGYGHVVVDKHHTYSTVPANARKKTICAISATRVRFISEEGELLSDHRRSFGNKRTETIDPRSQLKLLSVRPGGWKNSRIRDDIPQKVAEHLDGQSPKELRQSLRLLHEASDRCGFEVTCQALDLLARQDGGAPNFFSVGVLAARIANFGLDTVPDSGADLDCYDRIFLKGQNHAIN
jgi:transposase